MLGDLALCCSLAFLPLPSFMSPACKLPTSLNYILLVFVVEMLSDNDLLFGKHVSLEKKSTSGEPPQKHCRHPS